MVVAPQCQGDEPHHIIGRKQPISPLRRPDCGRSPFVTAVEYSNYHPEPWVREFLQQPAAAKRTI
jgi:hypothetical protein